MPADATKKGCSQINFLESFITILTYFQLLWLETVDKRRLEC